MTCKKQRNIQEIILLNLDFFLNILKLCLRFRTALRNISKFFCKITLTDRTKQSQEQTC